LHPISVTSRFIFLWVERCLEHDSSGKALGDSILECWQWSLCGGNRGLLGIVLAIATLQKQLASLRLCFFLLLGGFTLHESVKLFLTSWGYLALLIIATGMNGKTKDLISFTVTRQANP